MNKLLLLQSYMRTAVIITIMAAAAPLLQAAPSHAQALEKRLSVAYNSMPLREVILDLQEKANADFGFAKDLYLDKIWVTSKRFEEEKLRIILQVLLAGKNIAFEEKAGVIVLSKMQQAGRITGKVTDANGDPLVGATIRVVELNRSVNTNEEGDFFIDVQPGIYTVEVSFISYLAQRTTDVEVEGGRIASLNFELQEDAKALDEVVVVGYGSMARKDITSSITTVKPEDFNVGTFTSPAQVLQGKVPGLLVSTNNSNPNATPSVTLRGASTLRTGEAAEPYYVIDGVPGASLSFVSPDDIESIDVLRDASATAIYGSKASNGVIIVTTKKGKAGQTSINYSGYIAVDKVAQYIDMMNASQYRQYVLDNGFSLEPYDDRGADTEWQREVERTGVSTNHNVSIIGGSEKTKYNMSINYFNNDGVIKGTDMARYIGRGYVETKALEDRLSLSFNVNASMTNQNDVPQGVYDAMHYYLPISPVKTEEGEWFENTSRSGYVNPVSLIEESTIYTKTKWLQAHVKGQYQILPGLNYNLDLSLQNRQYNYADYYTSKSMVAAGMNGRSTRAAVEDGRLVFENNLSYEKTLAERHKVSALAV